MNTPSELGTRSVRELLVKYATPAIIAMMVSSLYNLVDSIFIGHGCGSLALAGLTIAKPMMDICAAFGSLVGVGAASMVAIKLGEGDYAKARQVLGNVVVLNVILSALVMVVGLSFLTPILYAFGASDATLAYAYEYMEIILWGNVLTHLYFGLNNVLRSSGHPRYSMVVTIVAVITNIILDYVFIFPLQMGVRGAALATVLAQALSVALECVIFLRRDEIVRFCRDMWMPDLSLTFRIVSIGMSPFLMNMAHCVVVVVVNNQLFRFGGDIALAEFGIVNRFIFLFAMCIMGLNQGMQPIVGYNYGAKRYRRVYRGFRLTAMAATVVMAVLFVLAEAIPEQLVRIFTNDLDLIYGSIMPMRVVSCMMLVVGFQMVTGHFLTSIGMASKAIFLSLTRQVLYLIPLLLVLPHFFPADPILGVWWAMPVSDLLSAVTAVVMLYFTIARLQPR